MKVHYAAATDVGRRRPWNEDGYLARPEEGVFAVLDGMGGQSSGSIATDAAIQGMEQELAAPPTAEASPFLVPPLARLLRRANEAVRTIGHAKSRGCGATLAAIHVGGTLLAVAHVGNCRVYHHGPRGLRSLTTDHSLIQEYLKQGGLSQAEAEALSPHRSIVTRALGIQESVEPTLATEFVEVGDRVLLCSDGLYDELPDADLAAFLARPDPLPALVQALIQEANARGGKDNITALLVQVDSLGDPEPPRGRR
jgi:protein phosphatase